jgi:uncharacterized DUF497 family protein
LRLPSSSALNETAFEVSAGAARRLNVTRQRTKLPPLDWDVMLVELDDSQDYGEERWLGTAPEGGKLYYVVFTVNDEETIRIISLRRATNSEIRRYETQDRK